MNDPVKISDLSLDSSQRNRRSNLRNAFLIATREEILLACTEYAAKSDWFAIACLIELSHED